MPADRRLASVLTDAALQALFMKSRLADKRKEAGGRKFLYGVDANVIRFWGNPRSGRARSPYHVGRIFREDPPALATAIALGLLTFIFEELGSGRPGLILIPPIESEVASILDALQATDVTSSSADLAKRVSTEIARLQLERTFNAQQLASVNVYLQDLIFQRVGEHEELRRILLLFSRRRLIKLDELEGIPDPVRDVLLPGSRVIERWYDYARRTFDQGGWKEHLTDVGGWRTEHLLENDAKVLARLEAWNETLASAQSDWRILYITADRRMFRAAADRPVARGVGENFADSYLRHPRAYLSEAGVLGSVDLAAISEPEQQESVGEWLTLLTDPAHAEFSDLLDTSRDSLDTPPVIESYAARMADERTSDGKTPEQLSTELLNRWDRYAKGAVSANTTGDEAMLGLTRDLKTPASQLLEVIRDAHEALDPERRRTLSAYLSVTTRLGRSFESGQAQRPLLRSVAPIYFEDWPAANEAIAVMSRWSDDRIDEVRYEQAIAKIGQNDKSLYAFNLGNAAFFAARGRWRSATLLARQARSVTLRVTPGRRRTLDSAGVNGREAAYFEAVCRRHTARRKGELQPAYEALEAADEVLALERSEGRYHEFVGERLEVERALLDLTSFYLELASPTAAADPAALCPLGERVWELLRTEWKLLGASDEPRSLPPIVSARGASSETAEFARLRVETELSFVVISLAFVPNAREQELVRAKFALDVLEHRIASGLVEERNLSCFELAFLLGARLRGRAVPDPRQTRRRLRHVADTIRAEEDRLLPFELPLLERLLEGSVRIW